MMKPSAVSAYYDSLDVWYRSLWGDHLHHGLWEEGTEDREEASSNLLKVIARAADLHAGMRICDVGSGYGGPARWLARETGVEVLALTNSPKQFELAEPAARVEFRLSDWRDNGLPDASFDAAVAIESSSHFQDPSHAIGEMLRVVKPGGRVVIATWLEGDRVPGWARPLLLDPIRKAEQLHGLATGEAHRRWARENGAAVVEMRLLGDQVSHSWSSCMERATRAMLTNPRLLAEALRHPFQAVRLAFSSVRIWLAYRLGVLDYAIFTLERPGITSP